VRSRLRIALSRRHEPALQPGEKGVFDLEQSALRLMHRKMTFREDEAKVQSRSWVRAPWSSRGPRQCGSAPSRAQPIGVTARLQKGPLVRTSSTRTSHNCALSDQRERPTIPSGGRLLEISSSAHGGPHAKGD
jgi:hypothetical protein